MMRFSERDKQTVQRMYRYLKPYRFLLMISFVASILVGASAGASIKMIEPLIDKVLTPKNEDYILYIPVFIIGIFVVRGVSTFVQNYSIVIVAQSMVRDIRNELFRHLMSLQMRFYLRNDVGRLMSNVMNDVTAMQNSVSKVVLSLVEEGATLIGLLVAALWMDWKMTLVAICVMPLVVWPAKIIGRRVKKYTIKRQESAADLNVALEQGLSGIKIVKSFGGDQRQSDWFKQKNETYYNFIRKKVKYSALSSPIVEIMSSFGVTAVIWFGVHRVINDDLTQGQLVGTIVAIIVLFSPIKKLSRTYNKVQESLGAAERVFSVIDEPNEMADHPGAIAIDRAEGELTLENVCFSYGDELVLTDINAAIKPGEVIALVGASGAGKSTLVSLINRFFDPEQGRILLDGHDLRDITLESLKKNMALVDQETFLFNDTILNNLRYGRPEADQGEVERAATMAYADTFIRELPLGYETPVGDRGFRLSGGQKQRLCIARALLKDAPVLLLDEATSALDTESEAVVQKALANLMADRTTIVIAHRLSTVMHADRIFVMKDGQIVETGTHSDLLSREGLYKKLYTMQFKDDSTNPAQKV